MNFITGKEQSVTLKSIDMALSSALQRLAREAKVGISYNPDDIPDQTVGFEFKNVSVHQALYTLLEGTNLVARLSPTKDVILINKTNNPLKLNHSESIIQETVSGRVTDTETGETLPGVNILIKGTTTGTTTATNGIYEFLAPSLNDTLVFSYIGYQTQEIPINGRNELDVQLEYDVMGVEDLVVVGYGTQREQTLTGSISVVDMSGVERVSMPTVGQALMGRTPGVLFHNSSGHPGRTELSINIRGYGAPLIIVDGTPVSEEYFQNINSIDIESVNVLKDASAAAVYGARAGNGVMIVTTKRGNISAPQFSYRGEYARQFTPNKPGLVNASQYAEMENLGNYNQGLPPRWTPEQIELLSNGTDPNYPNHNYWDLVIRDSAPQHQNTLSVRGGSETVQYFVSGEWFNQDGFLRSDAIKYDRYSLRSNLDLYLTERLSMGLDVALTNRDYFGPSTEVDRHKAADGLGPEEIMMRIWRARPYCREDPFDDGRLRAHCGGVAVSPTILMDTDKVGFYDWNQLYGFSKLNLEYDFSDGIFEGVLLGANFDFNRTYRREKVNHKMATQYDQDPETGEYIVIRSANAFSQVIENQSIVDNINQNYYLKWINQFGQHDFNFLALYERLYDNFDDFSADRRNYEMDIPYLFAGPDLDKNNYGIAREGGREAFVSRLNYSYQDKYLFEINGRFDASPNFPPESRWGFFPSAAIGWRMSEENFMKQFGLVS
ncbi:MAG: SusC/RagA family TonB-linked outer membrane protein, partial [Candidatus Babeliales bacterium]